MQYSTGTSHCSCRLTQGRPLCRPATFVPIMLQAHTMHLRTSIKGTHFSRTVTRRILADAHRHSFTVAMSEFGLEWAIHRGAKRRAYRCYVLAASQRKRFSPKHLHQYYMFIVLGLVRFLFPRVCMLCDFHFPQSFLLTAPSSHCSQMPNVGSASCFLQALALANNFQVAVKLADGR